MPNPIPARLERMLEEVRPNTDGEVANYIQQLREADPEKLAIAMCTVDGNRYSAGDDEHEFSIQSISKPFVYGMALEQLGPDEVASVVGVEPSGEAFHEPSLDEDTMRPDNPMINAGAIAVNQLIGGPDMPVAERVEAIRGMLGRLAGRELALNEELAKEEFDSGERNLAIAHLLRSHEIIQASAHDAIESYTAQCSIMVTVRDLAVMAATLGNGGVNPVTGERVFKASTSRAVLSVMSSAGMYDAAGRWMMQVGIPAKSGVSGGLIGTMPGQLGIATLAPRLDAQGNSVRGVELFKALSTELGLHLMSSDFAIATPLRSLTTEDGITTIKLQGSVTVMAAEQVLTALDENDLGTKKLIIDVEHVTGFHSAALRMVREGLERLRERGLNLELRDPDEVAQTLLHIAEERQG